jgi:hypothetical protein
MTDHVTDPVQALHQAAVAGTVPVQRLPQIPPGGPLAREWATYCREVGRLLADGHRGRYALVQGDDLIAVYGSHDAATAAGRDRFGAEPFLVLEIQPVIGSLRWGYMRVCPG